MLKYQSPDYTRPNHVSIWESLSAAEGGSCAHQVEMLVISAQLQAVVTVLSRIVEAVVGAWAGDDEVRGLACCKAVEKLPVVILQCRRQRSGMDTNLQMGAHEANP